MENDDLRIGDEVPNELRELLIQFSIAYLIDRPDDIIDYGVFHFQRLQGERDSKKERSKESYSDEMGSNVRNGDATSRHLPEVLELADEAPAASIDSLPIIRVKTEEDVIALYESMKNVPLFRSVSEGSLRDIIDRITCRKVAPNEIVYHQGDRSDRFYMVKCGTFELYRNNELWKTFVDKGGFGELALLYAAPRTCTVKAVTKGLLWQLDRLCFRSIVFHNRAKYEELFDRIDLFRNLTADEKIKLADAIVERQFKGGDQIYKEGDTADGMYFIQSGRVTLRKLKRSVHEADDMEMDLDEGDVFGELGLFTGSRVSSAYAFDTVDTAFLDISAFNRLIGAKIAMNDSEE